MQTTTSGPAKPAGDLYFPTDISPEELFKAIGRLRKEAQDEIERLLAFLDSIDDCDEDTAVDDAGCDEDTDTELDQSDEEPSLGSPIASITEGQTMWAAGDPSDREADYGAGQTTDDEPSLGWTSSGDYGLEGDREAEHDGREPEDEHGDNADMEPSLGWPEANGTFGSRKEVRP